MKYVRSILLKCIRTPNKLSWDITYIEYIYKIVNLKVRRFKSEAGLKLEDFQISKHHVC